MGFISAILFALFGRDYVVDQPDTVPTRYRSRRVRQATERRAERRALSPDESHHAVGRELREPPDRDLRAARLRRHGELWQQRHAGAARNHLSQRP